jgi:ArsR family transcriptional regulator, arsenate/arsenite/antimonite-responsive transcriptional repressor
MEPNTAVAALQALAHEHRLAAFRALVRAGPEGLAVGALRERLDLAPATLTAHLNVLRKAGLVADTREGRVIRVRAEFARMYGLIDFLTENCCEGASCTPASPPPAAARKRAANTR